MEAWNVNSILNNPGWSVSLHLIHLTTIYCWSTGNLRQEEISLLQPNVSQSYLFRWSLTSAEVCGLYRVSYLRHSFVRFYCFWKIKDLAVESWKTLPDGQFPEAYSVRTYKLTTDILLKISKKWYLGTQNNQKWNKFFPTFLGNIVVILI